MKTIHKYALNVRKLEVPENMQFLQLAQQAGKTYMWLLVDTDEPLVEVSIEVVGTGWTLYDDMDECFYLGSVLEDDFVWHYFMRLPQ